jgi:hypothetical protein
MNKLAKNSNKQPQRQTNHQAKLDGLTLNQQNNFHFGASEIDALSRLQDKHPEIVKEIFGIRKEELRLHEEEINLERKEQEVRINEVPYMRKYAFIGQSMVFSLSILCLSGGAYFGYHQDYITAGLFLTSSIVTGFSQFFNKRKNITTKED